MRVLQRKIEVVQVGSGFPAGLAFAASSADGLGHLLGVPCPAFLGRVLPVAGECAAWARVVALILQFLPQLFVLFLQVLDARQHLRLCREGGCEDTSLLLIY